MRFRPKEGGYLLLLTFAFLIVLVELTAAMAILISGETLDIGAQNDDKRLLYLADAGVERALREIRDDYTTSTQTGVAYLSGSSSSGSVSVGSPNNMFYFGEGTATINANTDDARVRNDSATNSYFDANYVNTRIISVAIAVRASRPGAGSGSVLTLSYTTTGVFPEVGNSTFTTPALTTTLTDYSQAIMADRTWTWATIMGNNFILRAQRTGTGTSNVNIDSLFLIVTYEIDTATEPWATGSYQAYPLALGVGNVQSVSIAAEQGKVHLNTASQILLRYLMEERGVASATANTVATNIVSYRAGLPVNNFDSVEELQQVTGMTSTIYDLIKDYVTVYSFINIYAQRPAGSRAPVNINTASREVLEAILDDPAIGLGVTDAASLAADIINTRAVTPFTCFYSANTVTPVTSDFFDFVNLRAYLTATERARVLDIADPSSLIPVAGTSFTQTTTELCYDTNAFKIESVADVGGRDVRVKTILGDQGSRTFTTFIGDTTSVGYRKENFE